MVEDSYRRNNDGPPQVIAGSTAGASGAGDLVVTPLEYAVYGVLSAAKWETGEQGARRIIRIQERLDCWDEDGVPKALVSLMNRGWVRQLDPILGMIHYEVTENAIKSAH